jgi:ribonucleoside-diphosphate reductase alpha chain
MKVTIKNPFLEKLLKEKGKNDKETWESIRNSDGSVQHLDFLSSHEKEVFKTFSEIDQVVIIDHAAARQQFIDQGQSLNLMVNPSVPTKDINALYIFAWQNRIKTLYYQHSTNAAQKFSQEKMCVGACEA